MQSARSAFSGGELLGGGGRGVFGLGNLNKSTVTVTVTVKPAFATCNLRPSKKEVLLAEAPAVCQQHNVVTELKRNHKCLTEVLIETTWEYDLSLNN